MPIPHRFLHLARSVAALAIAIVIAGACGGDAGSGGGEGARGRGVPKVLLIGLDGVRLDVLGEVSTPNLDALVDRGLLMTARTTTPSVSGPSWSSMLTGVWPEKHGVTDNEFTGKRFEEYPDFLTRIEQTRPEMSTAAIADWAPLMDSGEGAPTLGPSIDVRHALDGYDVGWAEADARSAELAADILRTSDPDALFVYLGNPDETSHEHGSIGEEYRAAITLADRQAGQILAALRARPTLEEEDWLVLVSTDHGRREDGGHGGDSLEEMTTFIIVSGGSIAGSTPPEQAFIVDVAVTALAHLGIEAPQAWGLDGRALGRPPTAP